MVVRRGLLPAPQAPFLPLTVFRAGKWGHHGLPPEPGAGRWPVCSASDGVGEVSSSGSRQVGGLARFLLCWARQLCGFFQKRLRSHTCLCARRRGAQGDAWEEGITCRHRPQSRMRETVMSLLEAGGRKGQMPLVPRARRGPPATYSELAGPHPGAHCGHCMNGDRPQVRAAADPRLASRRGSEQTDQKLHSSHGALPNSKGRQV